MTKEELPSLLRWKRWTHDPILCHILSKSNYNMCSLLVPVSSTNSYTRTGKDVLIAGAGILYQLLYPDRKRCAHCWCRYPLPTPIPGPEKMCSLLVPVSSTNSYTRAGKDVLIAGSGILYKLQYPGRKRCAHCWCRYPLPTPIPGPEKIGNLNINTGKTLQLKTIIN